jgi:hypothetical protein
MNGKPIESLHLKEIMRDAFKGLAGGFFGGTQ